MLRIRALLLADILMIVGKAGIAGRKASFALLNPALYGISQFGMKQVIVMADTFFNQEYDESKPLPILEFDVEYQDQLVPVSIEWKKEKDANFYMFCIGSATFIYMQFIWYHSNKLTKAYELRKQAIIAGRTAEVARLQELQRTMQSSLAEHKQFLINSRAWVNSIDDADMQLKILGIYRPTWNGQISLIDEMEHFDDLSDARKTQIMSQMKMQQASNIAVAEDAARQAAALKKSKRWVLLKQGFIAVDTGLFLGTGVLRVLLPALGFDEGEMLILNDLFGEDFVDKYNIRMPLGITDLALIVGIYHLFGYFAEDLDKVGIPATPEAALIFALGLMGDYWKVVIDTQQLLINLTPQESIAIEDMTKKMFVNLLMQNMANPYILLEGIIAVLAVKALAVIWVLPTLRQMRGIQAS